MLLRKTALALSLLLAAPTASAQPDTPAPTKLPRFDLAEAIAAGPPMTAARAATLAISASPSMAYAQALSREAEASVALARTGLYPRLELEARYTHVDGFEDGRIDTGLAPDQLAAAQQLAQTVADPAARQLWLNSLAAQGGVVFEIPRNRYAFEARIFWSVSDVIFAVLPAIEAADERVAAMDHTQRVTRASVELTATEAFYTLAKARGTLAVAQASERVALAQRVQIEAALRAGFSTESDLLAATARVASAGRAVAAGEAAVAIANGSLRLLMGMEDGPAFGVGDAIFDPPGPREMRYRVLVKRALRSRPELAALRASLRSQSAASDASDAAAYPHLGVFGGVTYANPNPLVIPPTAEFTPSWQVGAVLTWSPNDLLTSVSKSDLHAAQRAATEARIRQQELAIRIEVRQALEELRAATKARAAANKSLTASEAEHTSRLSALRNGAATSTDVFTAAAELDRARLALLDASVAQRVADAKLHHAVADSQSWK